MEYSNGDNDRMSRDFLDIDKLSRAQGSLLGQLAGDSLGSLVEFRAPDDIRREYPSGVRELADGGTWNTIAGQPTDDSEMALLLARMLADQGRYDPEGARKAYIFWLDSGPFDCGMTVAGGLWGRPNPDSQANGAMMRISPLGIFGANHDAELVAEWAQAVRIGATGGDTLSVKNLFDIPVSDIVAASKKPL